MVFVFSTPVFQGSVGRTATRLRGRKIPREDSGQPTKPEV